MKNQEYTIQNDTTLLESLFQHFKGESRTTVKSYLRNRQVSINNMTSTQFDHELKSGDVVKISSERTKESLKHPLIRVVYEDDNIIVVNKNSGLLSIATDKETQKTAYNIIREYLRREDPSAKIFIIHRLDRETSGLMLFAKDERTKLIMQRNWNESVLERKYLAVTNGVIEQEEGVISTYLTESKALKVYATIKEQGKIARTKFRVLKTNQRRELTLLELQLDTGRKNQIRAHLEYVGHPIIGDKKYGATKPSPIERVALHAQTIVFIHPVTGKEMKFETSIPTSFLKLF